MNKVYGLCHEKVVPGENPSMNEGDIQTLHRKVPVGV